MSITNVATLTTTRQGASLSGQIAKTQQALSTGKRTADPSDSPAEASIGSVLNSAIQNMSQASKNASQATALVQLGVGALDATNQVLTRINTLAAQANSDSVQDAERAMIQQEASALLSQVDENAKVKWGKTELLSGGSSAIQLAAAGAATAVTAAVAGDVVSDTFAVGASATFTGHVTGTVSSVSATANGGSFDVGVKIGNQIFKGNTDGTAAAFTLTSVNDANNSFQLTIGTALATTAAADSITELQVLQRDLNINLKNASFTSASTDISGTVNTFGTTFAPTPGGTTPGVYSLSYDANTEQFKLTNGGEVFKYDGTQLSKVAAGTSLTAAQDVTFNNGFSFTLPTTFNPTTDVGQFTMEIAGTDAKDFSFQIGQNASDTLGISFQPATVSALGLSGVNLSTQEGATSSVSSLTAAIDSINNQVAALGGKKSQLNFAKQGLDISIQNQQAAKSTFEDVDFFEELNKNQTLQALEATNNAMFQQSLQKTASLAQLVQAATR